MNKILKISLMSVASLFLLSCGSGSIQQENPLVNALLENGIDISPNTYSLNKVQAICIVRNLKDLSSERQWERFQYEELEMDERTEIDYLEDGITIFGDILQGEFGTMMDGLRGIEASVALDELKLKSIQICDESLWSNINGNYIDYENSIYDYEEVIDDEQFDNYKDKISEEEFEEYDESTTEVENSTLDNTATLIQGLSAGVENKIDKEFIQVIVKTSEGEIKLELNNKQAPITVENFITIANSGYYEGTIFHKVIDGFMIQGGGLTSDMNNKSSGTSPIQNEANNGLTNDRGTIAMARTSAPHSATSQFFINLKNNDFLNHSAENSDGWGYAVFGVVTEGMDIVDQIADITTMSYKGYADVPAYDITIESVTIIE